MQPKPTANQLLAQARWEREGVRRAAARYREAAVSADPSTLPSGQWLLREIIPGLTDEIVALQKEASNNITSAGRTHEWAWAVQLLPAPELALITLVCGFNAVRQDCSAVTAVAKTIAASARDEIEYRRWVEEQSRANKAAKEAVDWEHQDVLSRFHKQYPDLNRKVWCTWRRKVEGLRRERWSDVVASQFGAVMVKALCDAAPEHFSVATEMSGGIKTNHLRVAPDTTKLLNDIEARATVARPLMMPMLIPPNPWRYGGVPEKGHLRPENARLEGGYHIIQAGGLRTGIQHHTAELNRPVSEQDLASWNAVQETPWRINEWILDVMTEAHTQGLRLGGLEVGVPMPLPTKIDDDIWKAMPEEARKEHRKKRLDIHAENASINGKSQMVFDLITVGWELREVERFYFPHVRDFRHRLYNAVNRGPNPQGSDPCKALLHFADGVALGEDGLFWLAVRAANCFGFDKATLEERVEWTLSHLEDMRASIADPLRSTWWTEAAEPWSFLASSREIIMAVDMDTPSPNGEATGHTAFVSHLPVPLDGSCNGLQHLSAMGLDPVGAKATNLTPDTTRQDIYQEVARRVALAVSQDALDGNLNALAWYGNVSRKTVKRAVMTTPYGVTSRGIRDQLINDGHIPAGAPVGESADYMTRKIQDALEGTVGTASAIMAWLQDTAARLAKAGLPFDWTTPTGSRVRQAYREITVSRTTTLSGKLSLQFINPDSSPKPKKQAAGSAPNFVHSFDAAHLSMTVNAAVEAGINHFAMIHDSYGTHAGNTTKLGCILREQFVSIYSQNWLVKLKQEIEQGGPKVEIADPPERGDFDVSQALRADYFFS